LASEELRIGVYICHCGTNIAGNIDVEELRRYAEKLPNVVVARNYVFMCSEPGQELIKKDIKEYKLNRVVVAACSPSLHELTFRKVVAEAGLNPYLMEMVNIREHVSWTTEDKLKATEKAKVLVRMGVMKASKVEPLEDIKIGVKKEALIVGGGIAGLRAALVLGRMGFRVRLVEKRPFLGGHTARIPFIQYLLIRGDELIDSLVKELTKLPNVKIYTSADVSELEGSAGSYRVKLRLRPRFVSGMCTACGKCEEVCPVEVLNEYEYGIRKRKAIYIAYRGAYPPIYVIDPEACTKCGKCVEVCPVNAIDLNETEKIEEFEAGAVILAIGYSPYEPEEGELGYKKSPRVITLFQLQRMLDERGPTKGRVEVDGGKVENIVFISCVGSMGTSPRAGSYCSRMCCNAMISAALKLKDQYPDSEIYILFKDIRTYGYGEELYWKALERGVKFVRYEELPEVRVEAEKVQVIVRDVTIGVTMAIPTDLLILVNGMAPSKWIDEVTKVFRAGCGAEGFLREAHLKLRPVDSPTEGIFLAGSAVGPRSVIESIIHGSAAASKAATILSKDLLYREPIIAVVYEDLCSGCRICIGQCPYNAISTKEINGRVVANVNPALCAGCGTCAAACPSGAMQQQHFKDEQILAQIYGFFGR